MGSKVCHNGTKPVMQQEIINVKRQNKCLQMNLHSDVPKLDCTSVLAIDVSKKSLETYDGSIHRSFSQDNIQELLELKPTKVFLESTGVYHRRVTNELMKKGIEVYECDTQLFKDFRKNLYKNFKTDKTDVESLWHFARLFKHKKIIHLSHPLEPLLNRYFYISQILVKWSGYLEASTTIGYEENISYIKGVMKVLRSEKKIVESKISEKIPKRLQEEFGLILSAFLTSKRPERFSTKHKWVAYLGFKLDTYESGKIQKKQYCTKKGPSRARKLLYLRVMNSIQMKREPYASYHARLKARMGVGRRAMFGVMRRMARRFWAIQRHLLYIENK